MAETAAIDIRYLLTAKQKHRLDRALFLLKNRFLALLLSI